MEYGSNVDSWLGMLGRVPCQCVGWLFGQYREFQVGKGLYFLRWMSRSGGQNGLRTDIVPVKFYVAAVEGISQEFQDIRLTVS